MLSGICNEFKVIYKLNGVIPEIILMYVQRWHRTLAILLLEIDDWVHLQYYALF